MNSGIVRPKLDQIDAEIYGRSVESFFPTQKELDEMISQFIREVDNAAGRETVLRVVNHNPESLIAFRHKKTGEVGFVALLPLNVGGHIALADARLSSRDPQTEYICTANEKPHSIYVWGISISHKTSGGIAHVMKALSEPKYAHATLYCKAANARAEKLFLSFGFTKGAMINGFWRPDLMEYARPETQIPAANDDRPSAATPPVYDSYDPENASGGRIGIKLVHTSEEFLQVMMIRGAAYLGDQGLPWAEDVDRNDYCGAHLIGYVGNEPAACLRVRFFAGFVKLERLAVIPRFRNTSVAMRIVRAGIAYSRMKGYSRFYGQTERSVFPIWRRFGFVLRPGEGMTYLTDRSYVEGDMVTAPANDPITPMSGGNVLVRPEGQWHRTGVLEDQPETEGAR